MSTFGKHYVHSTEKYAKLICFYLEEVNRLRELGLSLDRFTINSGHDRLNF